LGSDNGELYLVFIREYG